MKVNRLSLKAERREGAWMAAIAVFSAILVGLVSTDTLLKTEDITGLRDVSRRTAAVVTTLDRLMLELTGAQNSVRGYLLLSDPSYLETYRTAADGVRRDSHSLLAIVSSPGEAAEGLKLQQMINAELSRLSAAARVAATRDAPLTPRELAAVNSEEQMAGVRQMVANLRNDAEETLGQEEQEILTAERRTRLQIMLSVSVAALCVAFALVGIFFENQARRRMTRIMEVERSNAIAANRTKSSFLAYTSHELRTPLNAIIGFSEFLMMEYAGPITERQKQYLVDIRGSGLHLQALIGDILDLTKAEAGKITLAEHAIDLPLLISACAKLVEGQAKEADVSLRVILGANLPRLKADELRCKQILINLAINAIKFTPPGGEVSIEASLNPAGQISLIVRDTGNGISAGDLEKVIEPYYRSGIDEPSHKGYGLGLPLARKIIELHGGSLTLASEVGNGTTAHVTFPSLRTLAREVEIPEGGAKIIPLRA
jgi:signal transduction histidine kinase